jgi:hypothetical protein
MNAIMEQAAERREELAQIPIDIPDAVPKRIWRKKKLYGKANARALTAAELATIERSEQVKRGKTRATTPLQEDEDKGYLIPDTPPSTHRAPQLAGESQGGTSITITRLAPRIAIPSPPPPPPAPSISLSPDPVSLPASTAPPRLPQEGTEIEGKRKRKYTKAYELGREQGLLTSLGHSQHQD